MYESNNNVLAHKIYMNCLNGGTHLKEIDILDAINDYFNDKIAIIWSINDVAAYANSLKFALSRRACIEILNNVHMRHDATQGISWGTFDHYIYECQDKRPLTHEEEMDLISGCEIIYMGES